MARSFWSDDMLHLKRLRKEGEQFLNRRVETMGECYCIWLEV